VVRDSDAEQAAVAELLAAGFDRARRRDDGRGLKIAPARLTDAIVALPPERFVVEADGIVHRRATAASLSAETGIDWFDLTAKVEFDDQHVEVPALLEAAKRGDKVVRLGDGTVGILPAEWLARVGEVADLAAEPAASDENDANDGAEPVALRFHRTQLALVDAMLGGGVAWDGPLASLKKQLGGSRELALADAPPGFRGELRDYQRAGLAWMQWLEDLGFSGCLADDMGLGKTIQVLALLAARKHRERDDTTSLVVAPRSVIYNWLDEAKRFAPGLRVAELRTDTTEDEALACDVVVTTYGIVRRRADLRSSSSRPSCASGRSPATLASSIRRSRSSGARSSTCCSSTSSPSRVKARRRSSSRSSRGCSTSSVATSTRAASSSRGSTARRRTGRSSSTASRTTRAARCSS
jgi:hypothetical protein